MDPYTDTIFEGESYFLELEVVDSDGVPDPVMTDAGTTFRAEVGGDAAIEVADFTITKVAAKSAGTIEVSSAKSITADWPKGTFELRLFMNNSGEDKPDEMIFRSLITKYPVA